MYDLVVVGSGGAGLACALSASARGARVLVLERSDQIGGTTAISAGGIWIPGNLFMEGANGALNDSHDAEKYLHRLTSAYGDESVLSAYVREARVTMDFLEEHTDVVFEGTTTRDYRPEIEGAAAGRRRCPSGNRAQDMVPASSRQATGRYQVPRTPVPTTQTSSSNKSYPPH